jgi:hypothetical protein
MAARRRTLIGVALCHALGTTPATAADLQPRTVAAFDRYVRVTEALGQDARSFLRVDALPEAQRRAAIESIRRGDLFIESVATLEAGKPIDVPDGLIHHWLGSVFVPGATVDEAVALLQDYDRHATLYRPNVARSKVLAREGDVFRVYLRFFMKKVITVVVDSEHEARFTRLSPDRAQSRIHSVRIAEVDAPDTPAEREKPVGRDGGYLWRLYTYWRFQERDGGTYVQCEAISLTRSIPFGVGWLVGPFVTSIPRESLTFTLETTRKTLAGQRASTSEAQAR